MRVVTDYSLAAALIRENVPVVYSHIAGDSAPGVCSGREYVIGRRYRGLFDEPDGSYVTILDAGDGETIIDRDSYAAIPIFYSISPAVVSTDPALLIETCSDLDLDGVAEYLSAAYMTGGQTIYRHLRFLMPDETIAVRNDHLRIRKKRIFPSEQPIEAHEARRLLERAIDNSIDDLMSRFSGPIALNLSGGADSTLLLAKIRERDPERRVVTGTYFHDDWRDDLDDWRYAEQAAAAFVAEHQVVKIGNESFCRAHRELVGKSRNVFHTYAAAFYAQNKPLVASLDRGIPIFNGSGPDESIIGTEKIPIEDLLSLRDLGRDLWIEHLIKRIDYAKIPEQEIGRMLREPTVGFSSRRAAIAERLSDAPDFVSFQRRYHAITVLQDHIQELSAVARALDRSIAFPYLTNDIFRIVFSVPFELLNANGIYKSIVKDILSRYMPRAFVHRRKIGFQSPSRPYFKSDRGLGRELSRLLARCASRIVDLDRIRPALEERLCAELDLFRRYDFLEWTVYNVLLLEEMRDARG